MRAHKEAGGFKLALNLFEGQLLRQCLSAIRKNYAVPPQQADPRLLATWYSSRGCEAAGRTPEEIAEWRQSLHQLRTGNLVKIENWLGQLAQVRHGRYDLMLSAEDAPCFLSVINDHRLLTAATQGIGEEEMSIHSLRHVSRLSGERQSALYQVHLLAYLMEELLALLME